MTAAFTWGDILDQGELATADGTRWRLPRPDGPGSRAPSWTTRPASEPSPAACTSTPRTASPRALRAPRAHQLRRQHLEPRHRRRRPPGPADLRLRRRRVRRLAPPRTGDRRGRAGFDYVPLREELTIRPGQRTSNCGSAVPRPRGGRLRGGRHPRPLRLHARRRTGGARRRRPGHEPPDEPVGPPLHQHRGLHRPPAHVRGRQDPRLRRPGEPDRDAGPHQPARPARTDPPLDHGRRGGGRPRRRAGDHPRPLGRRMPRPGRDGRPRALPRPERRGGGADRHRPTRRRRDDRLRRLQHRPVLPLPQRRLPADPRRRHRQDEQRGADRPRPHLRPRPRPGGHDVLGLVHGGPRGRHGRHERPPPALVRGDAAPAPSSPASGPCAAQPISTRSSRSTAWRSW